MKEGSQLEEDARKRDVDDLEDGRRYERRRETEADGEAELTRRWRERARDGLKGARRRRRRARARRGVKRAEATKDRER